MRLLTLDPTLPCKAQGCGWLVVMAIWHGVHLCSFAFICVLSIPGRNIAALRAQNKSFREGLIARWRTQLSAVLKKKKAGDEVRKRLVDHLTPWPCDSL